VREAAFVRRIAIAVLAATAALAGLGATSADARSGDARQARTLLDLGDSLSVGAAPFLRSRLPGYRVERRHDVGLHAYDAAALVAGRRAALPAVVVVSAGTNDDPRIVSTFIRSVSRIVRVAGSERCVVWPTIVRPPAVGATYDGLNRALSRTAARHRNLVLVDWVGMVRRHPEWLSADGVHVGVAGYRARAAAIATAVARECPRVTA
jgi:lysophospholipase L1-like esterase